MDGNELKDLRELVEFLKANEIAEFEVEKDELKLRLKFASSVPAAQQQSASLGGVDMTQLARLMSSAQGESTPQAPAPSRADDAGLPASVVTAVKDHVVKSPIVGTFYEAASPGSPPFVKVGDMVEIGQVLCIVEAMKLMNEIESDAAGEIVERIAVGGQPVEYGQPLFSIKAL